MGRAKLTRKVVGLLFDQSGPHCDDKDMRCEASMWHFLDREHQSISGLQLPMPSSRKNWGVAVSLEWLVYHASPPWAMAPYKCMERFGQCIWDGLRRSQQKWKKKRLCASRQFMALWLGVRWNDMKMSKRQCSWPRWPPLSVLSRVY